MTRTASNGAERLAHGLKRPYVAIFAVLAVVTLFEINIGAIAQFLQDAWGVVVTRYEQYALLLGTAAAKAGLVAMYYMHLRYEPRILQLVPLAPLVFVILLAVIVMLR